MMALLKTENSKIWNSLPRSLDYQEQKEIVKKCKK